MDDKKLDDELIMPKSKSISPELMLQAKKTYEEEESINFSSTFFRNPTPKASKKSLLINNTNPLMKNSPKQEEGLLRKGFSTTYEAFKPFIPNSNCDIDSIIYNITKNEDIIDKYKNDQNIKQLTNTEEIVDFDEYLQDCLMKIKQIVPAPLEKIQTVDYELNKTKCKDYL